MKSFIHVIFFFQHEVRSQDTVFVIASVALNSNGRDLAWQFFKDNWDKISERYTGGYLLSRLVKLLTEGFANDQMAKEVEDFFEKNKASGTERTVQQSIETILLNTSWLNRDSAAIEKYLSSI